MKIVIDIPEKVYTYIQREWEEYDFDSVLNHLINGIKRGTPLPEHHGDLIDRDDLLDMSYQIASKYYMYDEVIDVDDIKSARPIIKADKEE